MSYLGCVYMCEYSYRLSSEHELPQWLITSCSTNCGGVIWSVDLSRLVSSRPYCWSEVVSLVQFEGGGFRVAHWRCVRAQDVVGFDCERLIP